MTAEEIRNTKLGEETRGQAYTHDSSSWEQAFWLREIAAQLAEVKKLLADKVIYNDILRKKSL